MRSQSEEQLLVYKNIFLIQNIGYTDGIAPLE